jgi:phosphonatase-like hydrolase
VDLGNFASIIVSDPMTRSRRQTLKALAAAGALSPAAIAGTTRTPEVRPFRLVVLDVGGTIVQDRGDVPEALRSAFAKHGITVTPAEINEVRGASKREVVKHFVQLRGPSPDAGRDELIEAVYKNFKDQIIAVYASVPPIAGAEEAFQKMRASGLLLATTTGFDREITNSIFDRLGWRKYFAATITSDDVTQGRPSPYMIFHAMEAAKVDGVAEVVAVGDTQLDLQAGANAGVRGVIGVLSGVSNAEHLRHEKHTQILPSVADLPALLRAKA